MQAPVKHIVRGQTFWLSALRSVFWEEQRILIVSDLHLGKTGHFRKAGIAVPQQVYKEDLQRLITLLHYFTPAQLLVVGDFFHSRANLELDLFKRWRADFAHMAITLVKGNHDILEESWYAGADIAVVPDLTIGGFYFNHDYVPNNEGLYTFSGHLHPGVAIKGLGRQSLRFPCFYFTPHYSILPAFSRFTGVALVQPHRDDRLYAIVENALISIQ